MQISGPFVIANFTLAQMVRGEGAATESMIGTFLWLGSKKDIMGKPKERMTLSIAKLYSSINFINSSLNFSR